VDKFNFGLYQSIKEVYPAEHPTPFPGYHFSSSMPLGF